jgi:GNAT superfamily N-acetyltransferase
MTDYPVALAEDLARFCRLPEMPRLRPDAPALRQADAHLVAHDVAGQAGARASLWWTHAPPHPEQRIGCIGHFAATAPGAAAALLARAEALLAEAGCTLAAGPLDGNTFRDYRFVTRRAFDGVARPPFLLEPDNPDAWPAAFVAAGYTPLAEYYSAIAPLDGPDPRWAEFAPKIAAQGITLRALDPAAFEVELARLYDVVMTSFTQAFLFAPIEREEFMAQYAPLRALLTPQLVVLAEQEARLVGFMLALPDLAQAQRGETVDTVILKTAAVLPEVGGSGLGSALAAYTHTVAFELGFRHAIHALMHASNVSRKISAHYARPLRQYTLFAKPLAG